MRPVNENKVYNFWIKNDKNFLEACRAATVEPTRRQASKWLNKKGRAYKHRLH